ncbi:hypothetical protein [Aliirhizobium cellulosilyticum]|uniref:Uncharacterized protein n=1 Tax=Aliirhizobium cellulosilyticum TaxID=393664 RepID=A0A7W6S6W9_9HYPH|nr:hypothetical protein [Rhizobium cellulosilyticum]MBB4348341.1 hypothetical protein [Rhizobium cellulosilyticum]MBB4411577.1 hypothetical protein [Rhizobium cellulosilyticum]MBB4446268.1 hypothetical protein [Rhizobium cellulosilyticum]
MKPLVEMGVACALYLSPTLEDEESASGESSNANDQIYPEAQMHQSPDKHADADEKHARVMHHATSERLPVFPAISISVGYTFAEACSVALLFEPFTVATRELRKELLGKVLIFHRSRAA